MKFQHSVAAISLLLAFLLASSAIVVPTMPINNQKMLEPAKSNNISDAILLLTWTSRTQNEPLSINNESSLVGDHIVVNATFPESMNVTYCEMRIWNIIEDVNVTYSNSSSTLIINTYYLYHQNLTYNVQIIGNSSENDSWVIHRYDVEICNFFKPQVTVSHPEALSIDPRTYNLTWTCTDNNEEEVNYYSVWVSNNDGVTFILVASNVTTTWYLWNSTGWLEDDYLVRIRAYSIDLAYPSLDLSNPPEGYFPGDHSDGFSIQFHGDGVPTVTTTEATTSNTDTSEPTTITGDGVPQDFILIIIIEIGVAVVAVIVVLLLKRRG